MIHKSRAYRRYQREKHIERKEHILKEYRADNLPHEYDTKDLWGVERDDKLRRTTNATEGKLSQMNFSHGQCNPYWYVNHRGKLNKGKIHCSCSMCSYHGPSQSEIRTGEGQIFKAIETESLVYMKPFINKLKKASKYNKFEEGVR